MTNEEFSDRLMDNRKSIVKSLDKYSFEQKQLAKKEAMDSVAEYSDALYQDKNDPVMGNPNGKHVVVEFIDYNCRYCKKLAPTLERFIQLDPEAKVIVKEYPIFNNQPTSQYSALMGTALFYYDQAKYSKFHHAVITQPKITKESVEEVLFSLGIEKINLKPHLEKARDHIKKTRTLGVQLKVKGTPTVFVGVERMNGGFTAEDLIKMFN
ncbi:thioredoxin domain-containing protein [Photobacterium sagamiensis]|uniref:DsbA family protein n=1 Tax=Photobacterium sagamiensis TaxID=2910241 RepID=UPI003D1145C7